MTRPGRHLSTAFCDWFVIASVFAGVMVAAILDALWRAPQ